VATRAWEGSCPQIARPAPSMGEKGDQQILLYRIHGSSRGEPFVLIAQFRYLQEGINSVAFQTVNLETSGPVF
jgi:hypothetical protein